MNMFDYQNKTVLITGGASGVGKTLVKEFAKTKANIAFTYNHSTTSVNELIDEFKDINIKAYQLDLKNLSNIEEVICNINKDFGKIDVLINNAGIYPNKDVFEISEKEWDEMFETNTRGTFFLNREVSKIMKNGSIINISSINATNPNVNLVHYGASKKAVEMITSSLAVAFGPNIRVNAIAPGLIYRDDIEKVIPNWVKSYCERSPLKRLVNPKDIADVALFLGSDYSSAITGQVITVDCGITLTPCFDNK